MEITVNEMEMLNHIPIEEIKQDIEDTEYEIRDYQDELNILIRNRIDNKLRIYILEGRIINHNHLISKLNKILEYRNNNKS